MDKHAWRIWIVGIVVSGLGLGLAAVLNGCAPID